MKINMSKHAGGIAAAGTALGNEIEADGFVWTRPRFVRKFWDDDGRVGMTLIVGANQAGRGDGSGVGS